MNLYGMVVNDGINKIDYLGMTSTLGGDFSCCSTCKESCKHNGGGLFRSCMVKCSRWKNFNCGDYAEGRHITGGECIENGKIVKKAEDDSGRRCCPSEIKTVKLRIRDNGTTKLLDPGHAFIVLPDGSAHGFYPIKPGITTPGEIRNDKGTPYTHEKEYTVCPKTLQIIKDHIDLKTKTPGNWDVYGVGGSENCCTWANLVLQSAGLWTPDPGGNSPDDLTDDPDMPLKPKP